MTIKEMQDNIIGRFGLEAKETVIFFKMCEKLKEDTMENNALLKICHNSLLGIIDRQRVKETKAREEEEMHKAIDFMIEEELKGEEN